MREKRFLYFALGVLSVVSIGAVTNQVAPATTTGLAFNDAGITFPDGTVQTTAASGPVTAWPMRCPDLVVLNNGLPNDLVCKSVLPGVPGGEFGPGDGVPAGYFFIVTDVTTRPQHTSVTTTGYLRYSLYRRNSVGQFLELVSWTHSRDNESQTHSFNAPLLVLAEGDHLSVLVGSSSTNNLELTVTGYLTDQPEKLRL